MPQVHGVVHRQSLQPQHRADGECQPAGQAHPNEGGGQTEQHAEQDQAELGP